MNDNCECGVICEHGWYSVYRHRNWYEIEYLSPTYGTSIGHFPSESAVHEVFELIKEKIPAEAQQIALDYALEHFPELFKTHTPCKMDF